MNKAFIVFSLCVSLFAVGYSSAAAEPASVTLTYGGAPIPQGTLVLAHTPTGAWMASTYADVDGVATFDFEVGSEVKYRTYYMSKNFWSEVVTVPAAATIDIATVTAEVRGLFAAAPVSAGTQVLAYSSAGSWLANAHIDDQGVARFNFPEGIAVKYRIFYGGQNFWSEVVTVPETVAIIDIPTLKSSVDVTYAGSPIAANTIVQAYTASGIWLANERSDEQGRTAFDLVEGMAVKYRVYNSGKYYWSDVVAVPELATIDIAAAATTVGVYHNGIPAPAGAQVLAYTAAGDFLAAADTDATGVAHFNLVSGTVVKYKYQHAGGLHWSQTVSVPAQATIDVALARAEVVVNSNGGDLPAGLSVVAYYADGTPLNISAPVDQNGTALVDLVPNLSVKYRVAVGGAVQWSPVVSSGSSTAIDLEYSTVVVEYPDGNEGVVVKALRSDNSPYLVSGSTNANGRAVVNVVDGVEARFLVERTGLYYTTDLVTTAVSDLVLVAYDPTFAISPATGVVNSETEFSISGDLERWPGTHYYYTVDGSDPVLNGALNPSALRYAAPFTIAEEDMVLGEDVIINVRMVRTGTAYGDLHTSTYKAAKLMPGLVDGDIARINFHNFRVPDDAPEVEGYFTDNGETFDPARTWGWNIGVDTVDVGLADAVGSSYAVARVDSWRAQWVEPGTYVATLTLGDVSAINDRQYAAVNDLSVVAEDRLFGGLQRSYRRAFAVVDDGTVELTLGDAAAPTQLAALSLERDSDANGIGDNWQQLNGFPLGVAGLASSDGDGDGFTLLQEYLADSNPLDLASTPLEGAVLLQSASTSNYEGRGVDSGYLKLRDYDYYALAIKGGAAAEIVVALTQVEDLEKVSVRVFDENGVLIAAPAVDDVVAMTKSLSFVVPSTGPSQIYVELAAHAAEISYHLSYSPEPTAKDIDKVEDGDGDKGGSGKPDKNPKK